MSEIETLATCEFCGSEVPEEDLDHNDLCPTCQDETFICNHCGDRVHQDDCQTDSNSHIFCESCYNSHVFYCHECEETYYDNNVNQHFVGYQSICEDCLDQYYTRCEHCREYIRTDNILTDNYTSVCESCYSDYYFTCSACDSIVHQDYEHYNDDTGETLCNSCYQSRSFIHDYSYKPYTLYKFTDNDSTTRSREYYGIELEVDKFNDTSEASCSLHALDYNEENLYQKHDGSLSSNGIELVWHPRTLNSWMEYQPELHEITQACLNQGGRSHDTSTCGLHIHRSRKGLSELTIAKTILFLMKHETNITKLGRRASNDYCSFRYWSYNGYNTPKKLFYGVKDNTLDDERYVALNLCNHKTIEFRFLKGTLKTSTIIASIQLCDAMIKFCEQTSVTVLVMKETWKRFVSFVKENQYKELYKYIVEKNLNN